MPHPPDTLSGRSEPLSGREPLSSRERIWLQGALHRQTESLQQQAAEHLEAIRQMLEESQSAQTQRLQELFGTSKIATFRVDSMNASSLLESSHTTEDLINEPGAAGLKLSSDAIKRASEKHQHVSENEILDGWEEKERAKALKRARREAAAQRHEMDKQARPDRHRNGTNSPALRKIMDEAADPVQMQMREALNCMRFNNAQEFVNGPLDMIMGWVIIANAVVLTVYSQWLGMKADISLGIGDHGNVNDWEFTFDALEHGFMVVYGIELVFRIAVLRKTWLRDHFGRIRYFNFLDAVVVLVSAFELYVLPQLSTVDSPSLVMARLVRLARLTRTLRIIRVMRLFRQLRILAATFIASLGALFWSMVILLIFMFLGALVLCQCTHYFIVDESNDLQQRLWVNSMYGSASKAVYTMFEATNSGGWPNYARPLVEDVSPWFAAVYMTYVTIVVFGIIRIITALFIKETLSVASSDASLAVQESLRVKDAYRKKLQVVFEEADASGDKIITRAELETALENKVVLEYLSVLEIEVHEVEPLFDLLDDGDGEVTIMEFCQGVMRLKGQARALDVVSVMHDANVIMQQGRDIKRMLSRIESVMGLPVMIPPGEPHG